MDRPPQYDTTDSTFRRSISNAALPSWFLRLCCVIHVTVRPPVSRH